MENNCIVVIYPECSPQMNPVKTNIVLRNVKQKEQNNNSSLKAYTTLQYIIDSFYKREKVIDYLVGFASCVNYLL